LGVGEAAGAEGSDNLVVEILAIGDEHERGVFVRWITPQLERQPQHGEALAGALRMPYHAATLGGLLARYGASDRTVDGNQLLVTRYLAHRAPGVCVALEHYEVARDVEQVLGGEQAVEGDRLRVGLLAELLGEGLDGFGERLLPTQVK